MDMIWKTESVSFKGVLEDSIGGKDINL